MNDRAKTRVRDDFGEGHAPTRRSFIAGASAFAAGAALGATSLRALAAETGFFGPESVEHSQALFADMIGTIEEARRAAGPDPSATDTYARNERLMQDFLDKYSDSLVNHSSYAYPSFVTQYRQDTLANLAVSFADFLVHTGANEPDKDVYAEVLVDLIATYDAQSSGDVLKQQSLDDLKTWEEYAADVASMGADLVTVITGMGATTGLQDGIAAAVDVLAVTGGDIADVAKRYRSLAAQCKNYRDYEYLLDAIGEASGGDLAAAAREVRENLREAFECKIGLYAKSDLEAAPGYLPGYLECVFDDGLVPFLKASNNYRDGGAFASFTDHLDGALTRLNLLQDSWDLGTKIGTLVGDVVVGGEDLIMRLRQLCAIYDVSAVLADKLVLLEGEYLALKGTADVWVPMDEYVHLAEFLVACRLRGEYSIYSIVANDAGLVSLINSDNAEAARSWYDKTAARLATYQAFLPRILFRGIDVRNNGGLFVGVCNDVYYWRLSGSSVESTAPFGAFTHVKDTTNALVRRDAEGNEEIVLQDTASGALWGSVDCLFYQRDDATVVRCALDGSSSETVGTYYGLHFVDELSGVLVCTVDNDMVAVGHDGTVTVLARASDGDAPRPLCAQDGAIYYCYVHASASDERTVYIRSVLYNGQNDTYLDSFEAPCYPMCSVAVRAQAQADGLYVSFASVGGTALDYGQGGAARVALDGLSAREMLVDPYADDAMGHNVVVIAADAVDDGEGGVEAGTRRLYYLAGSDYSAAGWNLQPWVEGDIWAVDLETGEKAAAPDPSFVISEPGGFAFIGGDLMALLPDGLARYHLLISGATFAQLGYEHLQDFGYEGADEDGAQMSFVDEVDVVDGVAYVLVHRCARDYASDLGWRAGFKRLGSCVYQVAVDTDDPELLYEF